MITYLTNNPHHYQHIPFLLPLPFIQYQYFISYLQSLIYMLIQNSSKLYPQIYDSENQLCPNIQVHIRSETIFLTSKDFFQLTQIVQVVNIPEIKNLGLQSLVLNQNNLLIAHIFLYYCLKVNLKIQIQGLDSFYLKELGNLYVTSRFNIQIGKYSKLCQLITGINVRKCAHIIYYLVYGRLATNSYIESIIFQLTPQIDRKQKCKTIFSQSRLPKKDIVGKQKQSSLEQNEENAYSDLIQELKTIFQKSTKDKKKSKLAYYSNKQENYGEGEEQVKEEQNKNPMGEQQKKYYMNFFPNRIFNDQKSAIFERMHPNCRSNYKLMRKKRFNDIKIDKMLYNTFNDGEEKAESGQGQKDRIQTNKQTNRLLTYGSIKTNEKFKNVSQELDKIRTVITKGKKRWQNSQQTIGETTVAITEKQRQYLQLKQQVEKEQPQIRVPINQTGKQDYECTNRIVSLIRKQKNGNKSKRGYNENMKRSGESQRTIFGNIGSQNSVGNGNRMFHSDCQSRLLQYKNEYRKFMKVHFFVIDDE